MLEKINNLEDFKKIDTKDYPKLASDIREFLIDNVSKTGGHLAPNLGVVELTMALHHVFNSPNDKIIFDVGHQCYVHKILTGRKDKFPTLRKLNGLSGFPKTRESEHDIFNTGHSSTSISTALGIATANKLAGKADYTIAVIGDGAMTGGLAFEALNNAQIEDTNLIVILNDNQMSISPSVGNLSAYLNSVRSNSIYTSSKNIIRGILKHIPFLGKPLMRLIEFLKDGLRHLILPNSVMFEQFGFSYLGPIDGHDIEDLIRILKRAKTAKKPVLIHVVTQKGKGFEPAEKNPDIFHGVGVFDKESGKVNSSSSMSYSKKFGNELIKLAKENDKVVAISAAMTGGTGLQKFSKEFPDRFFDVGIAEGHAVTFAAGLASQGYVPVFAVYSTFLQRAYDQIVHDVALQKAHVIFAIDRAGIVGADGETHHGIYDLSYLSHIPNLLIMAPKDGNEFAEMMKFAVEHDGPVAIRYPRDSYADDIVTSVQRDNTIGKSDKKKKHIVPNQIALDMPEEPHISTLPIESFNAEILAEGKDVTILGYGKTVKTALEVAKLLKNKKVNAEVINCRFLKPLDKDTILGSIVKTKRIICIEDNVTTGGLASLVKTLILDKLECKKEILYKKFYSYPDAFIKHGETKQIEKEFGMNAEKIVKEFMSIYSK